MNSGNIYLIGMMGSGKTTVGKLLSEKMKRPYLDLDFLIETKAQLSVNDIFNEKGESYFRQVESEILMNINESRAIVSCGGGVILEESNRSFMRLTGKVVFLALPLIELVKRLKTATNRPLLRGNRMEEKIKDLWTKRKKYYEETAHMTIHTNDQTPEQIVEQIMDQIHP